MRLSALLLSKVGKQAYVPSRRKKFLNYAMIGFSGTCAAYGLYLAINMTYNYYVYQSDRRPQLETQKRELEVAMHEKVELERQAGLR